MNVDLFDDEGASLPCPAWQVIEAARRQYLTGELVLDTTPTTHVYLRDGQAYFAERSTDGGLGVRLLVEGVITRAQLQKGTLLVSGAEHLGRLFDRDTTIERESVELCVELMTDDVLVAVAEEHVSSYRMTMYKRHASGIDRWMPTRVEVITRLVERPEHAEAGAHAEPMAPPRSRPAATGPVPSVTGVVPTIVDPLPVHEPEIVAEHDAVAEHEPAIAEHEPIEHEPFAEHEPIAEHEVIEHEPATHETIEHEPVAEHEPTVPSAFEPPTVYVADHRNPEPEASEPFASPFLVADRPTDDDLTPVSGIDSEFNSEFHTEFSSEFDDTDVTMELPSAAAEDDFSVEALMSSSIADEVAEAVRRALAAIDASQPMAVQEGDVFASGVVAEPTPAPAA